MAQFVDLLTRTEDGAFKPKFEKGMVCLFAGESGSGKDNAIAGFPKPLYVFDVDHRIAGMQSAIQWVGMDAMKKIEYDQYSLGDWEKINQKQAHLYSLAKKRELPYKTIYFASITSLGQLLAQISRKARGAKPGESGDFIDAKFAGQMIRNLMYEFVMPMQEMGVNIVFAAHIVPKWGKTAGEKGMATAEVIGKKILGVSDQFSEEVVGYFDNVFEFEKKISIVGKPSYHVTFRGEFGKTAFPISANSMEITDSHFYEKFSVLLQDMRFGEIK